MGALAGVEDGANLRQQRFVFYGAVTNIATAPCVKARWRNAVNLTQHLHPKPVPLRIYEREDFLAGSEQNRMAFFRLQAPMSCAPRPRAPDRKSTRLNSSH